MEADDEMRDLDEQALLDDDYGDGTDADISPDPGEAVPTGMPPITNSDAPAPHESDPGAGTTPTTNFAPPEATSPEQNTVMFMDTSSTGSENYSDCNTSAYIKTVKPWMLRTYSVKPREQLV